MAIRIRCDRPGFRRAGIAHAASAVYPAGTFSEEQLRILRAEPLLTVDDVGSDEPAAPPPSNEAGEGPEVPRAPASKRSTRKR